MNQPSPCPQCRSERIWARAALGAYGITHVAFCPGCARAATLCGRCGGELAVARQSSWAWAGRPRIETVLHCPTCRQTAFAIPRQPQEQAPGVPAVPGGTRHGRFGSSLAAAAAGGALSSRSPISRLVEDPPASPLAQRVADECEDQAASRYARRRQLVDLVGEAARRADARARLEAELSRLAEHPAQD